MPTADPTADDLAAFRAEARRFLESIAVPKAAALTWRPGQGSGVVNAVEDARADDAAELERARKLQATLHDNGYGWLTGPTEFGGAGLPAEHTRVFDDLCAEFDLPSRRALFVGLHIVAPAIAAHGSPDLRSRVLAALLRGELVGCQLFSEPDAGSDLAGVRTRAVRDGEDWIVSGQKVWTSEAHLADVGEALVRTDPGAEKHAGLTMLLVDMHAPGVTVRPLRQMTGGAAFNEVFLDDVRVADRNRIGDVGAGWAVARTSLASERGQMSGSGGPLTDYVLDRLTDLVRRADALRDPLLAQRFADAAAAVTALHAAEQRDEQDWLPELAPVSGSVLKLLLVRALDAVGRLASDVLGASAVLDTGAWGDFGWSQFLLGVPGLHIAGGTDEIQRTVIAQRGLGLPRESAGASTT